jgi:hypothetical protein
VALINMANSGLVKIPPNVRQIGYVMIEQHRTYVRDVCSVYLVCACVRVYVCVCGCALIIIIISSSSSSARYVDAKTPDKLQEVRGFRVPLFL